MLCSKSSKQLCGRHEVNYFWLFKFNLCCFFFLCMSAFMLTILHVEMIRKNNLDVRTTELY